MQLILSTDGLAPQTNTSRSTDPMVEVPSMEDATVSRTVYEDGSERRVVYIDLTDAQVEALVAGLLA